jgi:peptidoglycan/LPS O-acetylase OafA/YrhL
LIPATLNAKGITLRTYTIHRFFRLYPAYWFSILVFIIVEMVFATHGDVDLKNVLVNLTMLQKFVGVPDVVGAFWTLQIELIFYGLCGILFITGQLSRREMIVVGALTVAMLCAWLRYKTGKELPVALFIALALMFLGDCLRALADNRYSRTKLIVMASIVSIALLPISLLAYKDEGMRYWLSYQIAILTFLLCFSARHLISRSDLANKIGQFLADCSYSVYLLHGTIGMAIARSIYAATSNAWLTLICAFAITIILSYLTYRFIEYPGIKIGKRLGKLQPDDYKYLPFRFKLINKKS